MAAPCGLDRRLVGCRCEERLTWRRQRVVLAASGGEETRLETPTPASSSVRTRDLQLQSRAGTWTTGAEVGGETCFGRHITSGTYRSGRCLALNERRSLHAHDCIECFGNSGLNYWLLVVLQGADAGNDGLEILRFPDCSRF